MRNSTFTRPSSSTHRSLFQRAFALVAIAVMAAVGLPAIATAANPAVITLTVHYQRPTADYATWNLWLWRNLGSGTDAEVNKAGVQFTGDDDYGKVVTVVIDNMDKYQDIGIIVRKGEWAAKDVTADRFITKFNADGTAEVWLRQADPTIYYEKPTGEVVIPEANKLAKLYDSPEFAEKYTYTGDDLGNTYSKTETKMRVWAPTATAVKVVTYATADALADEGVETAMTQDVNGTWVAAIAGDQDGLIYNYRVTVNGNTNEAVDPYVRATTINGERGVVVDLDKTDPANWK